MGNKYDKMTYDDEVRIISDILDETATGELLGIPGVWEAVREYYNNDMLDRWEREHAGDNEYGEQKPCKCLGANCCECDTCDTCEAEYGKVRENCPDCTACVMRAEQFIEGPPVNMRSPR